MNKCCANCEFYDNDYCNSTVVLDSIYQFEFKPDDTSKFFCSEFKPKEVTNEK